jgi:cyclopropane-fatty-acyl-phospholipid synthase
MTSKDDLRLFTKPSRKVSLSDLKKFSRERLPPFPGEKIMEQPKSKYATQQILDLADVKLDGRRSWDIRVRNQKFYQRVLAGGSLALGQSYMDGWWNCEALDQLFDRIMSAYLDKQAKKSVRVLAAVLKARITNLQRRSKAYDIGKRHYDTGNDLFAVMLDKYMNYSCGYWDKAKTLITGHL